MPKNIPPVPKSVEKALGTQASRDLEQWIQSVIAEVVQMQYPVSAFIARQKVNGLMLDHVSNLMMSGDPVLTHLEDGKTVWRVPIYLTMGKRGRIGQVGTIDVGVELGDISYTDDDLLSIAKKAQQLADDASL